LCSKLKPCYHQTIFAVHCNSVAWTPVYNAWYKDAYAGLHYKEKKGLMDGRKNVGSGRDVQLDGWAHK